MKRELPKKTTGAEEAYIRDLARRSAFEKVDRGQAVVLRPEEFPEPLKRSLRRDRASVRTRLPPSLVSRDQIQAFVDHVVRRFHPGKVILFGSYAYGRPTESSDVDLMVILPHRGPSARKATQIRLACPRAFPMDLLVRTPTEVRRRIRMGDQFLREVTSKGIVLHESRDARVG